MDRFETVIFLKAHLLLQTPTIHGQKFVSAQRVCAMVRKQSSDSRKQCFPHLILVTQHCNPLSRYWAKLYQFNLCFSGIQGYRAMPHPPNGPYCTDMSLLIATYRGAQKGGVSQSCCRKSRLSAPKSHNRNR